MTIGRLFEYSVTRVIRKVTFVRGYRSEGNRSDKFAALHGSKKLMKKMIGALKLTEQISQK